MLFVKEITDVLDSVKALSGVGLCYYDLNHFYQYHTDLSTDHRRHQCRFCKKVRSLPGGLTACQKSDRSDAATLAEEYRTPFFFQCHMGMRELVIPLILEDKLIGILFVGQCRLEGEEAIKTIRQSTAALGGDPEELAALYQQLPLVRRETLLHTEKVLSAFFQAKLQGYTPEPDKPGAIRPRLPLTVRMENFIDSNYNHPISTRTVAQHFFIHPAYASRLFHQEKGLTITEYIHHTRIEHAKTLLKNTSIPISSIALNIGFSEGNYFSRVFRKATGLTPQQYRLRVRE